MAKTKNKKINLTFLFITVTVLIVFAFFFHTVFYGLKAYDELTTFDEGYVPLCYSLSEMFELISLLGLNHCFEAANTLYSNIISFRCTPVGVFLYMLHMFIFKKSPVSYHLYSLTLHLINTVLIFLIIKNVSRSFASLRITPGILFTTSLLTLLWALHPVNLESILLLSNSNIVLGHTFCLLSFYTFTKFIPCDFSQIKLTPIRILVLFVPFIIALFIAEFNFMLPVILMAYLFAMKVHNNYKSISFSKSLPNCLIQSFKETSPLFIATIIFIVSFLLSETRVNVNSIPSSLTFERTFWFSPQILFHLISLIILPIKLSIDQSFFVRFGKSLFDPYAIFCILFVLIILIFSINSLFNANKKFPSLYLIFIPFILSLVPYSQILVPAYNLASERYLYFPSFVFIFGLSHFIFYLYSKITDRDMPWHVSTKRFTSVLLIIVLAYSTRGYVRTLDWKDTITLYKSVINATDNPLYKGFKYKELIPQDKLFVPFPQEYVDLKYKKLAVKYTKEAINKLKEEERKYQSKIPKIIKAYGLDPKTLRTKAGYIYTQADFRLNHNHKRTLKLMEKYVEDPNLLSIDGLAFFSSVYFHNNLIDKSGEILKVAHKKDPYSMRIIFITADLASLKLEELNEIEKYALTAFKFFPYDVRSLTLMKNLYKVKGDFEKYAHYSYIYGLRAHSLEDLKTAYSIYSGLNQYNMAQKASKRIASLERLLANRI